MRDRSSAEELAREGVDAVRRAVAALGLRSAERNPPDGAADLALTLPGGQAVDVDVKAASVVTPERARSLTSRQDRTALRVVVADQITESARAVLDEAGVGWLDRRGHLRLAGHGLFVDTDVPPMPRREGAGGGRKTPIAGRSGLAAASALLLRPDDPMGVSEIARRARLNPSSVTRAMASLVDANLAERRARGEYRRLVPELFWTLAEVWPRDAVPVRWSATRADDRFDLVTAGVPGAIAWGAPLVATADYPVHLYASDEQIVRQVKALHDGDTGAEVNLSVDPVGLITADPHPSRASGWPLAHPLFCALDLTVASRDREALEQWTPPEGFARVW